MRSIQKRINFFVRRSLSYEIIIIVLFHESEFMTHQLNAAFDVFCVYLSAKVDKNFFLEKVMYIFNSSNGTPSNQVL